MCSSNFLVQSGWASIESLLRASRKSLKFFSSSSVYTTSVPELQSSFLLTFACSGFANVAKFLMNFR